LTGQDSLCRDPYNQPVQFLSHLPIRVYSLDLPHHVTGAHPNEALDKWVEDIGAGVPIIETLVQTVRDQLDYLIGQGEVDPNRIAVGGLSRGGFVACHIAASDMRWKAVLGFAPLTLLTGGVTFAQLKGQPYAESLSLDHQVDRLVGRPIRFYIGNRDEQVGTGHCFHFLQELVQGCCRDRIRPAPVEMIMTPSVGFRGHGTLPPTFKDGANWVANILLEGS
jgi:esterase FrsA